MKRCSTCKELQHKENYTKHSKMADGLRSFCRSCQAKARRRYKDSGGRNAEIHRRRATKYGVPSDSWRRDEVFERDAYRCTYCGIATSTDEINKSYSATIDHFVNMSNGGSNTTDNVFCCCKNCNEKKHRSDPHEYISRITLDM